MLRKIDYREVLRELGECFRKWEIYAWGPVKEKSERKVTIQFLRGNQVQTVSCESEYTKGANLRRILLFLDALRKAEKAGITYAGLSSTTEIIPLTEEIAKAASLEDDYANLGLHPTASAEEVKDAWRRWSMAFHPDRFPESQREWAEEQFKEKKASYERICQAKNIK